MKIAIFEMVILRKIAKIWDEFRAISKNLKNNYFCNFHPKMAVLGTNKIFQPGYSLPIKDVTVKSQSE